MSAPILIVEDDDVVRSVFVRALRKEGHEVDEVADGEAALASLAATGYGVMLLDLRLPKKSGFDVLTSLAETRPPHPPIVLVLSSSPNDVAQVAGNQHVMLSVNKTFALQHLESIVSAISAVARTR